jgi:hypothetical protein
MTTSGISSYFQDCNPLCTSTCQAALAAKAGAITAHKIPERAQRAHQGILFGTKAFDKNYVSSCLP